MLVGPLLDGAVRIELTSPLVSMPYVRLDGRRDGRVRRRCRHRRGAGPCPDGARTATSSTSNRTPRRRAIRSIAAVRGRNGHRRGPHPGFGAGRHHDRRPLGDDGLHGHLRRGLGHGRRDPATPLRGIDVDMSATSDLVPTIAAVAVTASTPTSIRGVGFIRAKESDRLGDLARELVRTGPTSPRPLTVFGWSRCRVVPPDSTAPSCRPTTTIGWQWRSPCSAPPSRGSPSTTQPSSARAGPTSGRPTTRWSSSRRDVSGAARWFPCAVPA